MRERDARLLREGMLEHLRGDVRIAVAVAADPGADGEKRREPRLALERVALFERRLEVGVKARQLGEQRHAEVIEAVRNLVGDFQPRQAQHRSKPQPQHLARQRLIRLVALAHATGERALRDQVGDRALAVEDALALDFGRVRGQHRADTRAREPVDERRSRDAIARDALERVGEAARTRRRAGFGVRVPAPLLLRIFRDVEQLREEAERAHDMQGLLDVQSVQLRVELRLDFARCAAAVGFRAAKAHRGLADALDALEHRIARLLADHLSEQPPEQAPILAQLVVFRFPVGIDYRFHVVDFIRRRRRSSLRRPRWRLEDRNCPPGAAIPTLPAWRRARRRASRRWHP